MTNAINKGERSEKHKYKHSHAINILEHTTKFLVLLVFPLARALFVSLTSKNGFYNWLQGAWFDITVIAVIFLLGLFAWYKYVYYLSDSGIYIRQGIMLPKYRYIPYRKLSVVTIERTFYLIPFRAVRVRADTDGGSPTNPDFSITMYKKDVEDFIRLTKAPFVNYGDLKRVYMPKNMNIAILSFITSNSLTGVLFAYAFISGTGKVIGGEFESSMMQQLTSFASELAKGIPPVAAMLGFVLLGGWLLSFLINLVRHLRFFVARQSGSLQIQGGVVTRREYLIAVKRINLIEMRQTLLTKLFGFYTVFIHSNGYGKKKDELSVLMPSGEGYDLARNLELLLPEIPVCRPTVRPRIRYLSRFLIPPISWIGGVIVGWFVAYWIFDAFSDVIVYFGIMAVIPCVWYLVVKLVSYFHTGVGISDSAYTFCYTYGYRIKTVAVPKKRVVKLTIRRSLFQVMAGCCDLVILTYSEGKKRHVVPNVNFEEAKQIMQAEGFYKQKNKDQKQ